MHKSSILGAVAVVGIATFLGGAIAIHHGTPTQAASSAAPPRCSNVQLLIRPYKSLGGAAGHLGLWYRLHNLFPGSCSLQGYPGAVLLDRNFHSLLTTVQRAHGYIVAGSPPVRQVTLDQQHDAYFALEYSDVPVGNLPCQSAPYMMVTPPNDLLPNVTYSGLGGPPCAGKLVVSPVEPTLRY
jgi:hypothetical protein